MFKLGSRIHADRFRRNARDFRDQFFDVGFGDIFLTLFQRQDTLRRARLVHQVNRLIRQKALVHVFIRQLRRSDDRRRCVFHLMMTLELRFQTLQNINCLRHARLHHINFMETSRQCRVLLKHAAIVLKRGRADAAQRAIGQGRFDQIARVHRTTVGRTCANQHVNFVHE